MLHDPIGRVRFVRQLETDRAAFVAHDPHADIGVEAASRFVGSGQDLDRPIGELQHPPSLGGWVTPVLGVGLHH